MPMSKNIRLHPCCVHIPTHCYWSDTAFELDKLCNNMLSSIKLRAKPIELPVAVHWTVGCHEQRAVPGKPDLENSYNIVDTDCTWLVDARALKSMTFHEDYWPLDKVVVSKAVSAYLSALPDDWPVIVHYT